MKNPKQHYLVVALALFALVIAGLFWWLGAWE